MKNLHAFRQTLAASLRSLATRIDGSNPNPWEKTHFRLHPERYAAFLESDRDADSDKRWLLSTIVSATESTRISATRIDEILTELCQECSAGPYVGDWLEELVQAGMLSQEEADPS